MEKNLKKATVIVVCYNHSKYIAENLDSIINQTYGNIELIIGDDASPDNSVKIIQEWIKKNNIKAVTNFHSKNTGLAEMLNECIEMATGDYIKFIAADDFLHPESIEKCVNKLENLESDYSFVHTDVRFVDDSGKYIENNFYVRNQKISDENFFQNLLIVNSVAAPSVLIKTEFVKKTGKYNPTIISEDYDRWLKLLKISKCAYINEKLTYYRILETSVTRQKAVLIQKEEIKLRLFHDTIGAAKKFIDSQILSLLKKKPLDRDLAKLYINYPYSNKIISLYAKMILAFSK